MSGVSSRNFGTASVEPDDDIVAGSFGTWHITYTVGELGMDDGARLKIATNVTSDWGPPQFVDPAADNYCSVSTSGTASVSAGYHTRGYERPFGDTIDVDVTDGALAPGETITVTLGDRSQGSIGLQAQSYPERDHRFIVLVDPFETENYARVSDDLTVDIIPGRTESLTAVVPSDATVGEPFTLSVRGEDYWKNPTTDSETTIRVESPDAANPSETDLPAPVTLEDGVARVPVTFEEAGTYRLTARDPETGIEATTNPVTVRDSAPAFNTFWGDIHGQSEETVGTGTIEEYFAFARKKAFLDFASHAGNDFQIAEEFWNTIRETVREFHAPEEFVTFLCYEWSANTTNGGDHNVYLRDDDAEIHRSSNWQVEEGEGRLSGTYPIEELYDYYEGREDVLIIPHQGGRPATLEAFDPDLTPFIELVSVWGVFEWFADEAFERGYDVGLIGGSDDHTGRLGASQPTNVEDWAFPVKGGMMGVDAESLTRADLWDAFKSRRCWATTGARIDLSTSIDGQPMGAVVDADDSITLETTVRGTAPIKTIDCFRGADRIATERFDDGSEYIECRWTGARGKTRHKVQDWSGGLSLNRGRIVEAEGIGFDHPQQGIESVTNTTLRWDASTAGNEQAVRLRVDAPSNATITVSTPPVTTELTLADLTEEHTVSAGHLERRLELRRTGTSSVTSVSASFDDEGDAGRDPYYVRVRQEDGEMAWSSPIFVDW